MMVTGDFIIQTFDPDVQSIGDLDVFTVDRWLRQSCDKIIPPWHIDETVFQGQEILGRPTVPAALHGIGLSPIWTALGYSMLFGGKEPRQGSRSHRVLPHKGPLRAAHYEVKQFVLDERHLTHDNLHIAHIPVTDVDGGGRHELIVLHLELVSGLVSTSHMPSSFLKCQHVKVVLCN